MVRRLKQLHPLSPPAGPEPATRPAGRVPPAGDPIPIEIDFDPPVVPGYEIEGELGRGGMGIVYRARQVALQRTVALKMVLTGAHAGPKELTRFRAEAAVIARLQHPNIVQIYDVGEAKGRPYFVLEFVSGGSLAQYLRGTPQPVRPSAQLVETLARAVQAAHANGVVHRDLKPANILLVTDDGWRVAGEGLSFPVTRHPSPVTMVPKITDFGLAKCLDDTGEAHGRRGPTVTGEFLGTPNYMAPEQATARQVVGPAADVYALGAILYELLTGRPPFTGETALETVLQVLHNEPVSVTRLQPSVPRDLETICLKCLQKDPRKRYDSALELAEDLRRFQNGEPIRARPPSALYRWGKFAQRHKTLVAAVLGIVAALTLGAAAAGLFAWRAAEQRDTALRQAYYAHLAAAGAALRDDDVAAAARHLKEAPEALRDWEWHHLHSRLDGSATVFRAPEEGQILLTSAADGIRVVACGPDGPRLLDPDGGKGVTLPGRGLWINLVEHTAHGTRVFARETSGHLVVFDETGKVLRRLDPPPGCRAWLVAVSPDHKRLLVDWGEDGPPRSFALYDLASGEKRADFRGHTEYLCALAFSPDGTQVASSSDDHTARLWDAATGALLQVLEGHTATVWTVAFRRDGERVVTASADGTVRQWDVASGQPIGIPYRAHRNAAHAAVYSPDGRRIASGGHDGTVRLWGADDQEDIAVLHGHTQRVVQLAFSPDGRRLASASLYMDRTARVWEVGSRGSPVLFRDHSSYVYPVAYSPDGAWIASGSWDGTVRVWDARTGLPGLVLRHTNRVRALAFGPDNTWLVSGCDDDDRLTIWDFATGRPRKRIQGPGQTPAALAISPDGARLAAQDLDGTLHITDVATGQEVFSTRLPGRIPNRGEVRGALAYSPDGRWLAVVADRSTVGLLDTQSHDLAVRWTGHGGAVHSLAFCRDGRWLVSAGEDRTVRLWDVATGAPGAVLEGHTDEVFTAVFHPDGTRLASAGRDRAILLWDVGGMRYSGSGAEVARLHGHTNYVIALDFSPDGTALASGSADCTVRLWDTAPLAERLKARREAETLRPKAEQLVARLFRKLREPSAVIRAVKSDHALSDPFRREIQRAIWRQLAAAN
jgi:WD40 repeat protein/serine/threonine protein kinase